MNAAGLVALALAAAMGSACTFGIAITGDGAAMEASIFDLRVSTKSATAGGAVVSHDKREMSDNATEFGKDVAPLVAEAITKALLEESGAGLVCKIPEVLGELGTGSDEEPLTEEQKERRAKRLKAWETEKAWREAIRKEEERLETIEDRPR